MTLAATEPTMSVGIGRSTERCAAGRTVSASPIPTFDCPLSGLRAADGGVRGPARLLPVRASPRPRRWGPAHSARARALLFNPADSRRGSLHLRPESALLRQACRALEKGSCQDHHQPAVVAQRHAVRAGGRGYRKSFHAQRRQAGGPDRDFVTLAVLRPNAGSDGGEGRGPRRPGGPATPSGHRIPACPLTAVQRLGLPRRRVRMPTRCPGHPPGVPAFAASGHPLDLSGGRPSALPSSRIAPRAR